MQPAMPPYYEPGNCGGLASAARGQGDAPVVTDQPCLTCVVYVQRGNPGRLRVAEKKVSLRETNGTIDIRAGLAMV